MLISTNSMGRCCRQESRTASEDTLGQILLASEQPGRHHLCSELQEANKSDLTLRQHLLEGDQQACKDAMEPTDLLVSAMADCNWSQLSSADGVPPAVTSSSQIGMPSSQAAYSMEPSIVTA